jgi:hypothetical protein
MKRNNKRKNQSRAFCEMRYKFNKARRMKALEAIQENMNFVDCYDTNGNYLSIANEAISTNGNGIIPDKGFIKAYQTRKYEWLEEFNKHHGTTSEFCKEHGIKGFKRKRPWYVLLKRDSVAIESSKKVKKLNHTELMEGYVQHKLQKWEQKHPCPVKKDDLFYSQQYPIWEQEKQSAEERLRDLVINKYTNKLLLVGRFEASESKYEEHKVAEITDKFGETVKYGGVNKLPKKSKVMRKAQHLTNITKKTNPKCVCTNLKDHKKRHGRILLPKMAAAA